MATLTIANPAGSLLDKAVPELAEGIPYDGDENLTLALLDNGKRNARKLLEEVGTALTRTIAIGDIVTFRKKSVSIPPSPETIEEIKRTADGVITGVGD